MLELPVERSLVYVLNGTGVRGRLTAGTINHIGAKEISVYDEHGRLMDYVSGDRLRSWSLVDLNNSPKGEWHCIAPEDSQATFSLDSQLGDLKQFKRFTKGDNV
jgi:hypothetical protein